MIYQDLKNQKLIFKIKDFECLIICKIIEKEGMKYSLWV